MPVPLLNDTCRDRSLRAIITYKRPCNICCDCNPKKPKKPPREKPAKHRRPRNRCFPQDKSCPQRIERIAQPNPNKVQYTLARYGQVFDTERVINVCRFIHDLQNPKPPLPSLMKKARKKKRCMRPKAVCKSKKLKMQWLEKQSKKSSRKFVKYLGNLRNMIPNYKQLQVTMKLYKALNFRKLRTCNRFVKDELKIICQKCAILTDVKLQPYKQEFVVDQISRTTLDDKHCVFKMFEYVAPESEEEIEYQWEEEGKGVEEGSLYLGEEPWLPELEIHEIEEAEEEEEEGLVAEEGEEEVEEEEVEEEEAAEAKEREGGEGEEEGEGIREEGEYGEEDLGVVIEELEEEEYVEGEQEQGPYGPTAESSAMRMQEEEELAEGAIPAGSEEFAFEEELLIALEEEEEEGVLESVYEVAEEEPVMRAAVVPEEEESVMLGEPSEASVSISEPSLPDSHPDGTSSYVDWCLYVSWLKELGRNIEMYANCLQQFKATLQADEADKFVDTIRFILKNWSNYLGESRRVDQAMAEYFRDKPMTWCKLCRDCTIDDYPQEHYIPPELVEVIKTTKTWRRLLLEAEEYCNMLSRKEKGEEGYEEIEEAYEIYDVGTSSSSSFDVVALDSPSRRSRSRSR